MRGRTNILVTCGAALMALLSAGFSGQDERKLRVGTYDNRAIAIAYAPSVYNPVRQKTKEQEEAKRAGDEKRVAELEAWGKQHQRELHRQGFSRVPVDELLKHVEQELPQAARRAGVDLIAWQCDWISPGVEIVDVTDELVALFEPSEKTLESVREIRKHAFLDPDQQDHEH